MADFAPYQDIPPDRNRALSPPPPNTRRTPAVVSPRASIDQPRQGRPAQNGIDSVLNQSVVSPSYHDADDYIGSRNVWEDIDDHEAQRQESQESSGGFASRWGFGSGGGREDVDLFETRLGLRMDIEACLAYLLLPPLGGVFLLMVEHTSDYVRFHAWQSSLLFTVIFIVHVILSWSSIISWIMFAGDLLLIFYMTYRAYMDAATLERFQVPIFGRLANSILDDE